MALWPIPTLDEWYPATESILLKVWKPLCHIPWARIGHEIKNQNPDTPKLLRKWGVKIPPIGSVGSEVK